MKYRLHLLFGLIIFLLCNCQYEKSDSKAEKTMEKFEIDDVHSFGNVNEVKVTHLNWKADIDFENQIIRAVAKLSVAVEPGASTLILDTKGLNISKITLDNDPAEVTFSLGDRDEILGSPLTININQSTKNVTIHYATGEKAEALQWLSPKQAGGDLPFLFTQSQAILARSWVPIQDSPGIRFTYDAEVKVPDGMMALMSAVNPTEKNANGTYQFTMDQPIPAYLLALAAGDIQFKSISKRTGVYAIPSVIEKAVYEFGELENMVEAAESLYGPYRWDRYDILVLPPSFPFGGMENPRLTFATPTILAGDRSLTSLIAHELAHSWSGNLVTNATWNDFWLNEGFTVYFEHRIMEAVYGKEYAEMLSSLSMQGLEAEIEQMIATGANEDTKLKLNLSGRSPDDGLTAIAYDKGYFFLRQMEERVGRENFDAFLKQYFTENAFQVMTTEAFIPYCNKNLFEQNGLQVDNQLYDDWIYGIGLPEERPNPHSSKFADVNSVINKWGEGTAIDILISKEYLSNNKWSTHEWLHFLRNLPTELSPKQMQELDNYIGFTESGNSEILASWFLLAIAHNYDKAFTRMEEFLITTGRRKFLSPLYEALCKTSSGKALAESIYTKARPNYHYVSYNSIDKILGIQPDS